MFKEHPFISLLMVGCVVDGVVKIFDIMFGTGEKHKVEIKFGDKNKEEKPIDAEFKEV